MKPYLALSAVMYKAPGLWHLKKELKYFMAEWIDASEQLPEKTGRYLVVINNRIEILHFWKDVSQVRDLFGLPWEEKYDGQSAWIDDYDERFLSYDYSHHVQYWMPLPELPGLQKSQ